MSRRNMRTGIATLCALALAFGAGVHATAAISRMRALQQIESEIARLSTTGREEEAAGRLASLESWRDQRMSRMPTASEHGELLERITQDLLDVRAVDQTLAVDPQQRSGDYVALPITTTFRCTSDAAHRFLKRIESSDRPLRITSLVMVRDERSSVDQISVRIRMLSFSLAPEDQR